VPAEQSVQPATAVDHKTAEVVLALFDHLEDQINRTDTKAQVVLAADAILLGWFSTRNPTPVQALLAGHASAAARASALLIVLVSVGLFPSLASGLVVIWPRSGASARSTLVYFGGIARRQRAELRGGLPAAVAGGGDTEYPGGGAHHRTHRPAEVQLGERWRRWSWGPRSRYCAWRCPSTLSRISVSALPVRHLWARHVAYAAGRRGGYAASAQPTVSVRAVMLTDQTG
jgi:hypothetical protein